MTYYELARLSTVMGGGAKSADGIQAFINAPDAKGKLLGAWASELGQLNDLYLLRGFDSLEDLMAEGERARLSTNPFGCNEFLTGMDLQPYKAFPYLPPVETGTFGPVYEIRSYEVKRDGLNDTINRWEPAIAPRTAHSPLTIAMYSLSGTNRITHIWPYASLNDRAAIRAKTVAEGVWPPKDGPLGLTPNMSSTIALPLGFSPLK